MNTKILIAAMILVVGVGGFFAFSGGNDQTESTNTTIAGAQTSSSPFDAIETDLSNGGQLLDVRTPEEYSDRHIDKAINLPLGDIEEGISPSASKDAAVYVYCRSGNRSAQAKQILDNLGFTNVIDLGGIEEVIDIGGKTV